MRSLSPVEAALGVAVVGSVLAVGVPAFVRNLHASRLVEPLDGLGRIAAAAAARAAAAEPPVYPDPAPLTPAAVPRGGPVKDRPGTWSHPTWVSLGFGFSQAHSYSFEFQSQRRGQRAQYEALARGDLDGDGQLSEFSVKGEAAPGRDPVTFPLDMRREIE